MLIRLIASLFMMFFPWIFFGFCALDWDILKYSQAFRFFVSAAGVVFAAFTFIQYPALKEIFTDHENEKSPE